MKKLLVALCITCALALAATAGEKGKKHEPPKMTEEQKAVHDTMLAKYDINKDSRLDKEERAKMSTEDREKFQKAFPRHKKAEGEGKTETK